MTAREQLVEYLLDEGLLKQILFEYLDETLYWHPDVEHIFDEAGEELDQETINRALEDIYDKVGILTDNDE